MREGARAGAARIAIGAALLLLLGASGVVCQRVAERGRYATPYSTEGAGPDGARALFLLSDTLGARPERWVEDLGRLPEGQLLVALGGCGAVSRPLSRPERERLLRWIEEGGVLLVAGARGYLPEELGLRLRGGCPRREAFAALVGEELDEEDAEEEEVEEEALPIGGPQIPPRKPEPPRVDPEALAEGLRAIEAAAEEEAELPPVRWAAPVAEPLLSLRYDVALREAGRLAIDEESSSSGSNSEDNLQETQIILRFLDDASPAAVSRGYGRGRVILLASGSALRNREIDDHEGGVLFAHLYRAYAPGRRMIFDEFHLGSGSRRSLSRYLLQAGLGPLALQLLIVIGLLLLPLARRFGAPLVPAEREEAGSASYVSAVGALYLQAEDKRATAAILARRALSRLAAHHRLAGLSPAELVRELLRRGEGDAADAARELLSLSAMEEGAGEAPGLPGDVVEVAAKVDAALRRGTASRS